MLDLMTADVDLDSSSTAPSKEELLARVAGGDQAAFGELYDQIAPRVLGLVKRVLIDHAQSEEVTQEIFLEIWQTASRYESQRGGASTWIMTMARSKSSSTLYGFQSTTRG